LILIVAASADQVTAADVYGDYSGWGYEKAKDERISTYRAPKIATRQTWKTEIVRIDIETRAVFDKPRVGGHIAITAGIREETETDRIAKRGITNGLLGLGSRGGDLCDQQDPANRQAETFIRKDIS
jgi:hypothetical protein